MGLEIPYEEGEMIALLKQKNLQAFDRLYDKYAAALYSVVLQIVRNKEAGNNVLQKVFVAIWKKIDSYDATKSNLFIWMMQLAHDAAIEETRSTSYQHALKKSLEDGHQVSNASEDLAGENFGLKKAIHNLGDEQKSLIDLRYYKGLTSEQISEALSIPEDAVKTRIKTALSELRILLCKKK